MKVLVTDKINESAGDIIKVAAEVDFLPTMAEDELVKVIGDYDASQHPLISSHVMMDSPCMIYILIMKNITKRMVGEVQMVTIMEEVGTVEQKVKQIM